MAMEGSEDLKSLHEAPSNTLADKGICIHFGLT